MQNDCEIVTAKTGEGSNITRAGENPSYSVRRKEVGIHPHDARTRKASAARRKGESGRDNEGDGEGADETDSFQFVDKERESTQEDTTTSPKRKKS
jgi:hypothetical protein